MKRAGWLLLGVVCVAGCAGSQGELVRDYNADGVFLFQRGDYRSARESFQAALALKPEDPGLLYNVGRCYDHQGASDKAERFYNDCLQRAPNQSACRHALVVLLVRERRQADAVHLVEEWLAREPKKADPYAVDGWLWHQKGDLPRAQARLQQALEIDPRNVQALTELAVVYEEMQRPDRSQVILERALEVEPKNPEITQRLNAILTKGGKRPQPE
jgi:Tfp pilus assembly protein PilF